MYLKTILEIGETGSEPRVKAIASRLGVTMPSVTGAVETLKKKGLVDHSPYGNVKLTTKGRRTARQVKNSNDLILEFLRDVLKLPESIATRDACELEHVISGQTLDHVGMFLRFTQVCQKGAPELLAHFDSWLRLQEKGEACPDCELGKSTCPS